MSEESVGMNPLSVRSPYLFVDELMGGIPMGDLALPSERNAVEAKTIVDDGPVSHFYGTWRQDVETKPWGCYFFLFDGGALFLSWRSPCLG